jgi:NADH:ubiquinone oxidoreductase subunit 3 (subunit A)
MLTILLIIFIIVLISALLYIIGCLVAKRETSTRKKYQEHIDDLVTELFPPSIPAVLDSSTSTPTPYESYDPRYQEAKRKMIADIRTYFNQRKINAAISKIPGPDELAPVNPSAGSYDELTFPTPPSIERLME